MTCRPLWSPASCLAGGDALTFISVLRIIALWFPSRQNPLVLQLTAIIGQLGAVVSAVPLIGALRTFGWTSSFMAGAAIGVVAGVLVWTLLRDAPSGHAPPARPAGRESLRSTWAQPGTRLGMWTHFVTQFPGVVFVLLWGYPYLVQAQGLAPSTAGLLLTMLTLVGLVARTSNPAGRLGTASGIVNVGGFTASFVTIALIGIVLNLLTDGSTTYGDTAFRWAFAMQYPVCCSASCRCCGTAGVLARPSPSATLRPMTRCFRGVALVPAG